MWLLPMQWRETNSWMEGWGLEITHTGEGEEGKGGRREGRERETGRRRLDKLSSLEHEQMQCQVLFVTRTS